MNDVITYNELTASNEGRLSGIWHTANESTRGLYDDSYNDIIDDHCDKIRELLAKVINPHSVDMSKVYSAKLPSVEDFNGFIKVVGLCINYLKKSSLTVNDFKTFVRNVDNLHIFQHSVNSSKSLYEALKFAKKEIISTLASALGAVSLIGVATAIHPVAGTIISLPALVIMYGVGKYLPGIISKESYHSVIEKGWDTGDKITRAANTLLTVGHSYISESNQLAQYMTAEDTNSRDKPNMADAVQCGIDIVSRCGYICLRDSLIGISTALYQMA